MDKLLALLLNSGKARLGAGLAGGSSVFIVVMYLHADITSDIANAESRSTKYVDRKVLTFKSVVGAELRHSKERQEKILDAIKTLDKRVYDLKRGNQ